ncbi:MAG: HD domain-containing protein [Ignavibacteria bacterium]|nr:HD domain-containing protein [Ignavibacteria bacterium]
MSTEKILSDVKKFVGTKFREEGQDENLYHNLTHTAEVVNAVQEIAEASGVGDEDMEVLLIAAWFHDLGFIDRCDGHEDIGKNYAKIFLEEKKYPSDKIHKIQSLIEATRLPRNPKNLMEEVICDADLYHLGTSEFKTKGDLLKKEIETKQGKEISDENWLDISLNFFEEHKFYTDYAKNKYEIQKNINKAKIEKVLNKMKKKKEGGEKKMESADQKTEKKEKKKKKEIDKGAGRSIETMFRNTIRTHVDFSSMADTKANIMISVNTLVLTIIVSIMVRKLDTNPHLVIPTAVLTLTSLFTLIYAILVTRPKVTSGTFTEDDIKKKKANLLFFGNFHKMELSDFSWGMREMINDKEFLYDNMIKDFYYLGQVLGEKYRKLRISYTIFMWGIIISVIAFAIAFLMFPEGTDLGPIIE